jgi:3-methylcrotonyl-CoA carboxylase beta subunit
MTVKKHLRAQEIALENRLPCVYLVDSGGAFLPLQDEVFPDKEHFGRIFYNQARPERAEHPADRRGDGLVHRRRCLRAGDVRRIDHRQGTGHDLPRRPAAGEGRHRRSGRCRRPGRRRGAHRISGVADHFAEDDATRSASRARSSAPQSRRKSAAGGGAAIRAPRAMPRTRSTGSCRSDTRRPFDIREVIARIVDGSEFQEFKARYGKTLVCGFAHIHGYPVGIVANNGILFANRRSRARTSSNCATSATSRWCSCRTSPASWSASKYETAGIAKDGAKMVTAVACSHVPKFTV